MIFITEIFNNILAFATNYPVIAKYMTTVFRWVFVILAVYILLRAIISLLSTRATSEVWGYLYVEGGQNLPITHWENVIGRISSVDLRIPAKTVSRTHALLWRREDGQWIIKDMDSKNGTIVNGLRLIPGKRYLINTGDNITLGGASCTLTSISLEEQMNNEKMRRMDKEPVKPWKIMIAISIFQILTVLQLIISMGEEMNLSSVLSILALGVIMWIYVSLFRLMGSKGFELELIAFFMSTISLAVTASDDPSGTLTQFIAIVLGIFLYIFMCLYLRDLNRTKKIRGLVAILAILLLFVNIIFGTEVNGSTNWISIGGLSFQPSEIVKIAFIVIGAGTLEELYERKNLMLYAGFSFACLACLAIMGDFGTALIFFATFLVVSFLRSGDFSRLALMVSGTGIVGIMLIKFIPYISNRFSTWLHAWDYPDSGGYQQVRAMSYGSGGGLLGLGAGNGGFKTITASNTDLVFGFVWEEWGYVIAILLVLCIITMCLFAVNSIIAGRSTFYTIAACGAAVMFMVQTSLNVFGSLDILPFTGVTFPFISTGGTSMLASWAMLAFFKGADMRKDASLAIKKKE